MTKLEFMKAGLAQAEAEQRGEPKRPLSHYVKNQTTVTPPAATAKAASEPPRMKSFNQVTAECAAFERDYERRHKPESRFSAEEITAWIAQATAGNMGTLNNWDNIEAISRELGRLVNLSREHERTLEFRSWSTLHMLVGEAR